MLLEVVRVIFEEFAKLKFEKTAIIDKIVSNDINNHSLLYFWNDNYAH